MANIFIKNIVPTDIAMVYGILEKNLKYQIWVFFIFKELKEMILDLSKKQHIPLINMYKKCKGISLVDKYLPHLTPLNKILQKIGNKLKMNFQLQ